jgi:hypothetical protein
MPDGAAPAGPDVGNDASSVSMPPFTENALIALAPESTTQSVEPSGESRTSCELTLARTGERTYLRDLPFRAS